MASVSNAVKRLAGKSAILLYITFFKAYVTIPSRQLKIKKSHLNLWRVVQLIHSHGLSC